MKTQLLSSSKWLVYLRLAARTVGVMFAIGALLFVLMDNYLAPPFSVYYKIYLALACAFIVSMVMGFWFERLAGIISLMIILSGFFNWYLAKGSWDFSVLVTAIPSLMYLLSWYWHGSIKVK